MSYIAYFPSTTVTRPSAVTAFFLNFFFLLPLSYSRRIQLYSYYYAVLLGCVYTFIIITPPALGHPTERWLLYFRLQSVFFQHTHIRHTLSDVRIYIYKKKKTISVRCRVFTINDTPRYLLSPINPRNNIHVISVRKFTPLLW